MRAAALLKEIIVAHPEWNWDDLDGQGFSEVMYAFRAVPKEDINTTVLAFTVVKEFIQRVLVTTEKKITDFQPRKLAYPNRSYNNGFNAGLKEAQFLAKTEKTRREKRYLEIMKRFDLDLPTVTLIWALANGYKKNKKQIAQWAKEKYTQHQSFEQYGYYLWLSTFVEKLSPKDFEIFYDKMQDIKETKHILIKQKPVSQLIKSKPQKLIDR